MKAVEQCPGHGRKNNTKKSRKYSGRKVRKGETYIPYIFKKKNTSMKRKNKMKKGGRKRSRKRLEKI